jgi:serine/threonine protein kinase
MQLCPGTAVTSRLELVRLLSEGAMGSVWVARLSGVPRPVAVKFISGRSARQPSSLARFQREAAAISKIDSPNVVSILEQGATADGMPYIVMELLEGETLGQRLTRVSRLGLEDTAAIVRQVGYALDAAHRRGIVHRDVKPDNIFLVGNDDLPLVKLLDFGLAKETGRADEISRVTGTGVAVGTPEYMSPEQVLGGRDVDARSDLWAVAVVAYRVLAGVAPFNGDSVHALCFDICRGSYLALEQVGVPIAFDPWFRKALRPKQGERFQSGRELVDAFDRALSLVRASLAHDDDDEDDDGGATATFDASVRAVATSGVVSGGLPPSPHGSNEFALFDTQPREGMLDELSYDDHLTTVSDHRDAVAQRAIAVPYAGIGLAETAALDSPVLPDGRMPAAMPTAARLEPAPDSRTALLDISFESAGAESEPLPLAPRPFASGTAAAPIFDSGPRGSELVATHEHRPARLGPLPGAAQPQDGAAHGVDKDSRPRSTRQFFWLALVGVALIGAVAVAVFLVRAPVAAAPSPSPRSSSAPSVQSPEPEREAEVPSPALAAEAPLSAASASTEPLVAASAAPRPAPSASPTALAAPSSPQPEAASAPPGSSSSPHVTASASAPKPVDPVPTPVPAPTSKPAATPAKPTPQID